MTALRHRGSDRARFLSNSGLKFSQMSRIAASSLRMEETSRVCKYAFMIPHKFSIGFNSGKLPDQSVNDLFHKIQDSPLLILKYGQGYCPAEKKSLWVTSKHSSRWSTNILKYLFLFTVWFLGSTISFPVPKYEKQPIPKILGVFYSVLHVFWVVLLHVTLNVASSVHKILFHLCSSHSSCLLQNTTLFFLGLLSTSLLIKFCVLRLILDRRWACVGICSEPPSLNFFTHLWTDRSRTPTASAISLVEAMETIWNIIHYGTKAASERY